MLLQPSSYKFSACMYMVYFCTLVSNIWSQKFFLGPVTFKITFEIDWPPGPVALEASVLWRPGIANIMRQA